MPSLFDRAGSLARGLRRTSASKRSRRHDRRQDRRLRTAIDQLESRLALAITTPLSIGGTTVGSFYDAPTGLANLGDLVTVSIEGTSGTVIFNGGNGVADGTDIQTIDIVDASPDFQLTFHAAVTTGTAVPYGSDGVVQLGVITTENVIRGINTIRGPLTNVASPFEIETSAIHLYTFNEGTVSGTTVTDLIGGLDGTLFNGASVANGQLVLADISQTGANVQYMQMPEDILPQGSTAATFELWFTASNSSGVWSRGFDIGADESNYVMFAPLNDTSGSRAAIKNSENLGEQLINGTTAYNDGTQHLATVTIDDAASTMVYYIDGVQIGQLALGDTNLSGVQAINNFLGRSQFTTDPGFIGSMNQFAIYDRALNPTEVLGNYNAGPIAGAITPIGFTQTTPGSGTLELVGDQTEAFPVGAYVAATPLLPTPAGAPSFGTVTTASYDAISNVTTLVFDNTTAAGTTAGALTLAKRIEPEFRLTTFVGKNFSNRGLKDGGGLFVDVVEGGNYVYEGDTIPNLGILLTDGLLAYSTIGIRKQLAGIVGLGITSQASVDGRMFVESATPETLIYIGVQNAKTSKNSTFQLQGGAGPFGARVLFNQAFNGVVNLATIATGEFVFARGVGSGAVLNAAGWSDVEVNGTFAGTINSTFLHTNLTVSGNLVPTARVNSSARVTLNVAGSVMKGAIISSDEQSTLTVGRNFSGTINNGANDLIARIGGDVSGATIASYRGLDLEATGNVVNSKLIADDLSTIAVQGAVTNSAIEVTESLSLSVGRNVTSSSILTDRNMTVSVTGNVAKSRFIATTGRVTLNVGASLTDSSLISSDDSVSLSVGRDALRVKVITDDDHITMSVGGNFSGGLQTGSGNLVVGIGGSVLKGSTFLSGDHMKVSVNGNFDGAVAVDDLRFLVGGTVSKASRIVAQRVTDWQDAGGANFQVGGRFDGIVNVTSFDAIGGLVPSDDSPTATVLGNGAGSSARFNIGSFAAGDTVEFNGNFNGNMRVLQDLTSNLTFNGNVSRLSFGGRIGSFEPGNTITPVNVAITVAGRLLYLNSNSYFEATSPGKAGTFWNSPTKTSSTGTLSTGRYVTVVPTLQTPNPLPPPAPVTPTAPTAPQTFSAQATTGPDGIAVTFSAPSSNGGLPVLYYEYSTNALAGTPAWRKFDTASQGPGTNIPLTVDSSGSPFVPGTTYNVAVRAVNAVGSTATTSTPVTFPNPV